MGVRLGIDKYIINMYWSSKHFFLCKTLTSYMYDLIIPYTAMCIMPTSHIVNFGS